MALPVTPTLGNQPAKVYPALVGAVGALTVLSVVVVAAETTDPLLDSKVTSSSFAVHLA